MKTESIKKYYITQNIYIDIHLNEKHTIELIKQNTNIYYFSSDYHEETVNVGISNGPVNISNIYNFCNLFNSKVKHKKLNNRDIYYYVYNDNESLYLLNTIFLIGSYLIFNCNYNLQSLIRSLSYIFNDHPTSYNDCVGVYGGYQSCLVDCFQALIFVKNKNYFVLNNFDNAFYEYCNSFSYRDFNVFFDKMIALRSPINNKELYNMINIFNDKNIKTLIRLNNDNDYDSNILIQNNINIYDLYFEDCNIPSNNIIIKYLNLINEYNELIAIHCKAGLGRTGILICIWLIYKLDFKPEIAIAWLRINRPGSIHGFQGHFVKTLTKDYLESLLT
tara:strand:+ start:144 stop:1142 length:999 start_codon:yes stop_codon:yes gene_type:complete